MTPHARLVDRTLALTIAIFALLTPPIIGIFDWPLRFLGVPALHMYFFAVWLGAIVIAARLAARLVATPPDSAPPETEPPPPPPS